MCITSCRKVAHLGLHSLIVVGRTGEKSWTFDICFERWEPWNKKKKRSNTNWNCKRVICKQKKTNNFCCAFFCFQVSLFFSYFHIFYIPVSNFLPNASDGHYQVTQHDHPARVKYHFFKKCPNQITSKLRPKKTWSTSNKSQFPGWRYRWKK